MKCFEYTGFTLCIAAQEQMEARTEVSVQPVVVPEIPQSQMRQVHVLMMTQGALGRQAARLSKISDWRKVLSVP